MTVPKIEHIGWDLWRAASAWKQRFTLEMGAMGYDWFAEARGNLLQHIGSNGIAQLELAARTGISKQAVQQQLDELVHDGIVERVPDPKDARRKRIQLTKAGMEVLEKANFVKMKIETYYEKRLGKEAMAHLKEALSSLIGDESGTD